MRTDEHTYIHTDRQTDMTKLIVFFFRNFLNPPKIGVVLTCFAKDPLFYYAEVVAKRNGFVLSQSPLQLYRFHLPCTYLYVALVV